MTTLRDTNLYSNGSIIQVNTSIKLLYRNKVKFVGDLEDKYHRVTESDRLDLLAWKYYTNFSDNPQELWWVLADANNIHNPFDLSDWVGKEILIPRFDKL